MNGTSYSGNGWIYSHCFTSGRVSPKDVVKGYELGVNNYIKKPFLAEELDAHIGALLKMKQGMGAANESEVYQDW